MFKLFSSWHGEIQIALLALHYTSAAVCSICNDCNSNIAITLPLIMIYLVHYINFDIIIGFYIVMSDAALSSMRYGNGEKRINYHRYY